MASVLFQGTATNHTNLLAKIKEHLTDAAAMGTQVWIARGTNPLYLEGPGLSGTDKIFIQMLAFGDSNQDYFNLQCYGAVNYNAQANYYAQPGQSPVTYVTLWDSSIPYWLIANGRRFILVAKVSTTYQTFYGGFIMPYCTTSEYPYPIVCMGSAGGGDSTLRWSVGDYRLSGFWDPVSQAAYLRHWNGAWIQIANMASQPTSYRSQLDDNVTWPYERDYGFTVNQDGTYGLLPVIIHGNYGGGNIMGELEGVFFCSGFSNAAEDIITVGSDQYLVVQSAYRTSRRDYVAIKLG